MPPLETMDLTEPAVYFPPGRDRYGDTTRGDPVEIMTRWETGRRETVDANGTPMALDCTLAVCRELQKGGLLWLGCLEDWYGTGSGGTDAEKELLEVKLYSEARDLKGRHVRREVGLAFFRHTIPEETP